MKKRKGVSDIEYLVIYDDTEFRIIDAVSLKDCLIQLADYLGENTPLLIKALNGCETNDDMVLMFEHFARYDINDIRYLGNVVYKG